MSNWLERFIAKRIDGGLVNVFCMERKIKGLCPFFAFVGMLFVPVLVIAIFH